MWGETRDFKVIDNNYELWKYIEGGVNVTILNLDTGLRTYSFDEKCHKMFTLSKEDNVVCFVRKDNPLDREDGDSDVGVTEA